MLAVVAALAMATPAVAQSTGMVKGVVNDDKGQPVEGAKVTIEMNGGTGRRFESRTNKKGEYIQIGLTGGSYKITAEKDKLGSAPVTVNVRVNVAAQADLVLGIASAAASKEAQAKKTEIDNFSLTAAFMMKIHGQWASSLVSVLLIWSCMGSVFASLLGYSRIPYGAARYGHFFSALSKVHAVHHIPHVSLFLVGGLTLFWSVFDMGDVINALITTRILEQFVRVDVHHDAHDPRPPGCQCARRQVGSVTRALEHLHHPFASGLGY
jgi:hypothetical protein